MYVLPINSFPDRQEIIAFMQRYSFATIVTILDNKPFATHLPFLVKEQNEKLYLQSHFAKANPQAKEIFDKQSLIIFTEPHAYISPSNYEKELSVPTWNYLAVHAYGMATPLETPEEKQVLLEHTINTYEAAYMQQWDKLPEDFKSKMMNGITAFGIEVTDLQAKKKLSQNRSDKEIENVIQSLEKSDDTNAREIAEYMKQLKKD